MNFSLLWNLISISASGGAVYLMDTNSVVAILLAALAGLIVGLTSRFEIGVASVPDDPPAP